MCSKEIFRSVWVIHLVYCVWITRLEISFMELIWLQWLTHSLLSLNHDASLKLNISIHTDTARFGGSDNEIIDQQPGKVYRAQRLWIECGWKSPSINSDNQREPKIPGNQEREDGAHLWIRIQRPLD